MAGSGTAAGLKPLGGDDPRWFGRYRSLWRLASGGMGRIYLARSADDGSLVAVKTLLAEGLVSDTDRRRFTREVQLARRVDSECTARVLEADPDAEQPWMAIEYIPAPSLAELVREVGRLPGSAVQWIAAGTAKALVALHDEDVIHRDVKPQNILLPLAGPRLIDFGISHAFDVTRTSLTLGTIAFTSPEQARAEDSTPASDVYSLGATLFHVAVGRPPYADTGDAIRLLALVQRGELDLTGLPKALLPLIRPCLAADPAERPEPADLLDGFLEQLHLTHTSQNGERWLPPRWTSLIRQYEARGRALHEQRDTASDATTGTNAPDTNDARTGHVPTPGTRDYSEDRAPDAQRHERALHEQRASDAKQRTSTEQRLANALKAQQLRREREARETGGADGEAAAGDAGATGATPDGAGTHHENAAPAPEQHRPAAPVNRSPPDNTPATPKTRTTAPAATPESRAPSARDTAPAGRPVPAERPAPAVRQSAPESKRGGVFGGCSLAVAMAVAVVLLVWQPWNGGDSSGSGGTSSGAYTGGGSGYDSDTTGDDTDSDDGSGEGDSADGGDPAGQTSRPSASEDPEDAAFSAVRGGDCLDAYQDGYGEWSSTTPEKAGCDTANAYLRVLSVSDGENCPSGGGRGGWTHTSDDFSTTTLCVERQFRNGQCFLATADGDHPGNSDLLTVWNCGSDEVPPDYDYVMQVTAIMSASAGTNACPSAPGQYAYSYDVYDGKTMICTKVA